MEFQVKLWHMSTQNVSGLDDAMAAEISHPFQQPPLSFSYSTWELNTYKKPKCHFSMAFFRYQRYTLCVPDWNKILLQRVEKFYLNLIGCYVIELRSRK